MSSIKQINIKDRRCYFFDDMINIKIFDSDLLKIDKNSYKNIDIYYIGYTIMKGLDYASIHSVKPLHFIIDKADGFIEESNGDKFLVIASTCKSKDVLSKYTELWNEIKDLIKTINDKPGDYDEKYMKIKLDPDENLPLNKILRLNNLAIVVRSVFQEDNEYYPQYF